MSSLREIATALKSCATSLSIMNQDIYTLMSNVWRIRILLEQLNRDSCKADDKGGDGNPLG